MAAGVEVLTLPKALLLEIVRRARESLPQEAVGLVAGGAQGMARTILPLANLASDSRSFLADPYDQFLALRSIEAQQLTLLAITTPTRVAAPVCPILTCSTPDAGNARISW